MGSGPQLYDPSKYGGNAVPASGAAAGIGDATRAIQSYQDASKSRGGKPSLLQRLGKSSSAGGSGSSPVDPDAPSTIPEYKRGGYVRKTGLAKVHRGEYVLTAAKTKKMRKKRAGSRGRR